jgi:hypothetical protein
MRPVWPGSNDDPRVRHCWQAAGLAGLVPRCPLIRTWRIAGETGTLMKHACRDIERGAIRTCGGSSMSIGSGACRSVMVGRLCHCSALSTASTTAENLSLTASSPLPLAVPSSEVRAPPLPNHGLTTERTIFPYHHGLPHSSTSSQDINTVTAGQCRSGTDQLIDRRVGRVAGSPASKCPTDGRDERRPIPQ